MIEDGLKDEVRELVEAAIAEGVTLRVASVVERILEAHGGCETSLVRYYIEKTAIAALDVPCVPGGDVDLKREICEHVEAEFAARPSAPVSIKWVVGRVLTAHAVSGHQLREPLIDPDWLAAGALAGMKQVVLDVLAEPRAQGELQIAYVVIRDAEDTIVPRLQLTVDERRTIVEEDRRMAEAYHAEASKLRALVRRKAKGDRS